MRVACFRQHHRTRTRGPPPDAAPDHPSPNGRRGASPAILIWRVTTFHRGGQAPAEPLAVAAAAPGPLCRPVPPCMPFAANESEYVRAHVAGHHESPARESARGRPRPVTRGRAGRQPGRRSPDRPGARGRPPRPPPPPRPAPHTTPQYVLVIIQCEYKTESNFKFWPVLESFSAVSPFCF